MKRLLALLVFFLAPQADACTIPVFRYALEKWELTTYELVVFHRGQLAGDVARTLDQWNKPGKANLDVTLVDLDGDIDPKLRKLWERQEKAETPWLVARYPVPKQEAVTAWAGPCTKANLANLIDSPMRQAILSHLTRGASGVFVLMTSGDDKKDKAAYDLVHAKVQTLEKKLKLPEQSKEGPQIAWPLPLKVWLPILVLDPKKREEALLVHFLLNTAPELETGKEPILFTVFGRGRALPGMTGEDLNERFIHEVTSFLCGPCSCQIKDANPGMDLLLAANWKEVADKVFDGKEALPMPAGNFTLLPNMTAAPPKPVEPVPMPHVHVELPAPPAGPTVSVVTPPSPDCPLCRNWLWIATGGAGVLVLATGAWVCYTLRK